MNISPLFKDALRLFYPPQCMGCGDTVSDEGALCTSCWSDTDFLSGTVCHSCGVPLPRAEAGEVLDHLACDDCLTIARPWESARAAVTYRGCGRRLVLMLKHGDRLDIAKPLGDWLARAATPLMRPNTVVVPVPLHLRRLIRRKFNQSALLAARVAQFHGCGFEPDLLRRTRHTAPQDHRRFEDRFTNQQGAIEVRKTRADRVRGKHVLLVDDVMASGATLSVAANALLAVGAGSISVAVLARAVKDA